MKRTVAILAMLVVSAVAPATALAGAADQQAYSGSHVAFDTGSSAVVDYTVDGEQTIESVRVQSQSTAESNLGLGASAGLEAVTAIAGSAVTLDSRAAANASLRTESGASMRAHDNGHGSLVVTADDAAQYVALNVSADSEADQASDQRVVYETDSGATAAAMVVGDGNVSVTEDGNLTAAVAEDSRLVVRSYTEARSDAEATEERMIVNETAAASVYLMQQGDATVSDTVTYGRDTSVEVSERAASRVNVTVERTASEGRVVITHVSNETFESAEDVQVAFRSDAVTLHAPDGAPEDAETSARNRFRGAVVGVDRGDGTALVRIDVGAADPLAVRVTETSLDALGLDPGTAVVATFKATATRATAAPAAGDGG